MATKVWGVGGTFLLAEDGKRVTSIVFNNFRDHDDDTITILDEVVTRPRRWDIAITDLQDITGTPVSPATIEGALTYLATQRIP